MKKVLMVTMLVFILGGIMFGLFKLTYPIVNKIGYNAICQEAIEEIKADAKESGAEIISITTDNNGVLDLYYREGDYIFHVRSDNEDEVEYWETKGKTKIIEKTIEY